MLEIAEDYDRARKGCTSNMLEFKYDEVRRGLACRKGKRAGPGNIRRLELQKGDGAMGIEVK